MLPLLSVKASLVLLLSWILDCGVPSILARSQGHAAVEARATRVKRQFQSFPITGAPGGVGSDGSVPLRREIRDLENNDKPMWNLYILALHRYMQDSDQSSQLSYYGVAGIHGRPFEPWDGFPPAVGQEQTGYCTHAMTIFPTWHRAYLALYEQILYGYVQGVAAEPAFQGLNDWQNAAQSFRVPYWDWALTPEPGQPAIPSSITGSPWIQIQLPNGTSAVFNPFYEYYFHPLNTGDFPDQGVNATQPLFLT